MIAAGRYDWVDPDITAERFPVGKGIVRFKPKLFRLGPLDTFVSSENAVTALKGEGYEPATHVHGLVYGATFPDEQGKHPIACLGSSAVVHGNRVVVCLHGRNAERGLSLGHWDGGWFGRWRVLGVQEVSGA